MLQEYLPCYFIFNAMKESPSQFVAFKLDELIRNPSLNKMEVYW